MRFVVIAALAGLWASVATAQTPAPAPTPEVLDHVYQCASIHEDAQRLACYDTAVGQLHEASGSGQFVAVDRVQVQTLQHEGFGFNLPSLSRILPSLRLGGGDEPALNEVQVQITNISQRANGRSVFTTANNQTWSDVEDVSARNIRVGDTVTIQSASLGSFWMKPAHGGRGRRVHRDD